MEGGSISNDEEPGKTEGVVCIPRPFTCWIAGLRDGTLCFTVTFGLQASTGGYLFGTEQTHRLPPQERNPLEV